MSFLKKSGLSKLAKQRIRYVETPKSLVAIVQKQSFGKWKDTAIRETVDKARAAQVVRIKEAQAHGNTAGFGAEFDDTAGFGDRFKKAMKKIAKNKVMKKVIKAHVVPLKLAHKVTHGKNSPIRKMEMALQKTLKKNLPFTKPFIDFHNKAAGATHKAMAQVGIGEAKKKITAKAIADVTKKLPPAAKKKAQAALVKRANEAVVTMPSGATYRFDPTKF
jgi:hypothetical protein